MVNGRAEPSAEAVRQIGGQADSDDRKKIEKRASQFLRIAGVRLQRLDQYVQLIELRTFVQRRSPTSGLCRGLCHIPKECEDGSAIRRTIQEGMHLPACRLHVPETLAACQSIVRNRPYAGRRIAQGNRVSGFQRSAACHDPFAKLRRTRPSIGLFE